MYSVDSLEYAIGELYRSGIGENSGLSHQKGIDNQAERQGVHHFVVGEVGQGHAGPLRVDVPRRREQSVTMGVLADCPLGKPGEYIRRFLTEGGYGEALACARPRRREQSVTMGGDVFQRPIVELNAMPAKAVGGPEKEVIVGGEQIHGGEVGRGVPLPVKPLPRLR